ncbi:MAG: L-2-amino-thiazoline-4-carboxylic acid hydrolase [Bacteroidota bacterium]
MISCTEFIPAYSEGFKFLEAIGGRKEVEKFWSELSDLYLRGSLEKLVEEEGLTGCYTYWSHSLNEEAADFTMVLDEDIGEFSIHMHSCPSKGMLLELGYMEPYHAYCDHCDALYKPIVERFGYRYESEIDPDKARCSIKITRK